MVSYEYPSRGFREPIQHCNGNAIGKISTQGKSWHHELQGHFQSSGLSRPSQENYNHASEEVPMSPSEYQSKRKTGLKL